jgi:hypothetical protein
VTEKFQGEKQALARLINTGLKFDASKTASWERLPLEHLRALKEGLQLKYATELGASEALATLQARVSGRIGAP